MGEPRPPRTGAWRGLLLVLLLAAGLRAGYLIERRGQPDYAHPVVDAGFHDFWARRAAGLEAQPPPGKLEPELGNRPCLRPPAYPWLLAVVYRLGGDGPLWPRLINHLLGLFAVGLVYGITRGAFGEPAAVVAACALGLNAVVVYFEGELQAEPLLAVLVLAGLGCAVRALRRPSWGAWLATGILMGLAAGARANALLPGVAVAGYVAWRAGPLRARWRAAAGLALGLALAVLPITLRNARASGEFVPLTSAAGINLYLGNRAGASGLIDGNLGPLGRFDTCFDYPAVVASLEALEGREMTHAEVDRWFRGQALEAVFEAPGRTLALMVKKLLLALGWLEVGHNKEVALELDHSRVLRFLFLPFPLLLALALTGGWVGRRHPPGGRRAARDLAALCTLWALGWLLSLLPFFAAARYRLPLVPSLAPLVGLGLVGLLRERPARRTFALAAGLVLALALAAWSSGVRASEPKWRLDRGRGFYDSGDMAAARTEFEQALRLEPRSAAAHFELALALEGQRDLAAARREYLATLELDPLHPKANYNLGYLEETDGQLVSAARRYLRAIEGAPGLIPARARLAQLALVLSALEDPGPRDGALALRAAQRLLERPAGARAELLFVRAAAQAELGRFDEALVDLLRSREERLSIDSRLARTYAEVEREFRAGRPFRIPKQP